MIVKSSCERQRLFGKLERSAADKPIRKPVQRDKARRNPKHLHPERLTRICDSPVRRYQRLRIDNADSTAAVPLPAALKTYIAAVC